MDRRFDQLCTFLWIITGIFTAIMVATIWDRKTTIESAKRETIKELEGMGIGRNLVEAFRELAKADSKVAEVLKRFNLL